MATPRRGEVRSPHAIVLRVTRSSQVVRGRARGIAMEMEVSRALRKEKDGKRGGSQEGAFLCCVAVKKREAVIGWSDELIDFD
jgi:hypothetical protein